MAQQKEEREDTGQSEAVLKVQRGREDQEQVCV